MEFLKDRFGGADGTLPAGLPFFPTLRGDAVSKEAVVETLKVWHCRIGLAVVDAEGKNPKP